MNTYLRLLCATAVIVAATFPALAMDSMAKGEGMMIMSDGQTVTMKTMDEKATKAMMKHPMKQCVVMMMGNDGKMYMMTELDKTCGEQAKAKM